MIKEVEKKNFYTEKDLLTHLEAKDRARRNLMPKGYDFWQGDDNRWNNPGFASKKLYQFYHKAQEEKKPFVKKLEIANDKLKREEILHKKKIFVKMKRRDCLKKLKERKLERLSLQRESNQIVIDQFAVRQGAEIINKSSMLENRRRVLTHSGARGHLRKNPPNLWNDFSDKNKKILNLYLRPIMLKNEEEAVNRMKIKIENHKKTVQLDQKYQNVIHDVIYHDGARSRSHGKMRGSTLNHSVRSGAMTLNNNQRLINAHTYFYKRRNEQKKNKTKSLSFNSKRKIYPESNSKLKTNFSKSTKYNIEQVSPNSKLDLGKFDLSHYPEFKDMLIRDVDPRTAYFKNAYIEKLMEHSKFARERGKIRNKEPKKFKLKIFRDSNKKFLKKKNLIDQCMEKSNIDDLNDE